MGVGFQSLDDKNINFLQIKKKKKKFFGDNVCTELNAKTQSRKERKENWEGNKSMTTENKGKEKTG